MSSSAKPTAAQRPPAREGKKIVAGYFHPDVSRELRQIGLDTGRSVQQLLGEALNLLFAKHKRPTRAG